MTSADYFDPGEAPSVRVLFSGTPVARHGYACDGCPMDCHIPAGTRYGKTVSLVDGELFVQRHCLGGSCWEEHMAAAQRPEPVYGPDEMPF